MKYQQWNIANRPEGPYKAMRERGVPALVAATLCARGLDSVEEANNLLSSSERQLQDPFLMKDMDRAVARIQRALDQGETIAVYGDYDVDGITSTCLLTHYLRSQGGSVTYYIPNRLDEGYGVNRQAVEHLAQEGVKLIITVDCGITAVEEVKYARDLGLDMIVTDHHECKEEIPDAVAVVDPHRKDCGYPFKDLAGVGVALKVVMALGGRENYRTLFHEYADLAAVGTVADVMKLLGENRTIVRVGLNHLKKTRRRGLYSLMLEAGTLNRSINSTTVGYCLSPRINAAGRMGRAAMAAELILTEDAARADLLAHELCELNRQRQAVELDIFNQCIQRVGEKKQYDCLVLADKTWHQGVVGIVASRLSEKYACPSFMIHLSGHTGKGSCRSWGGFNLFAALEECSDLLLGFGGHELAAGFTIEEDKIPAFRKRMNVCVQRFLGGRPAASALDVDVVLRRPELITLWEVEQLRRLEPYGNGNNRPLFCLLGVTLDRVQGVGQNRHLKLRFSKGTVQLEGIFFSTTAQQCPCQPGGRVDVAFYLQINEFRGSRTVQLQVVDLRPSLQSSAREEESLLLLRRLEEGESLSSREALRILPSRQQCAAAWRLLRQEITPTGTERHYLPFLRQLSAAIPGTDPFLRACFCVELFCERGLLRREIRDEEIRLRLCPVDEKVDLEQSPYWTALQEYIRGK